ncbi:hypothetical protein Sp245p_30775 (plasmid) [Azospirillum baldaniorum]|uniref:Uncharacterized protein n=1 Tax=Azospirillum baldaniorum TaxID=1064539 RepID=A0A9P1NQI0_9PROT|nr:hypothetical protein Sp245p_30775 [Azospirillum baldaniorum]CCD01515.1 protein of unknown function [Azospirillum baldaniorum]
MSGSTASSAATDPSALLISPGACAVIQRMTRRGACSLASGRKQKFPLSSPIFDKRKILF